MIHLFCFGLFIRALTSTVCFTTYTVFNFQRTYGWPTCHQFGTVFTEPEPLYHFKTTISLPPHKFPRRQGNLALHRADFSRSTTHPNIRLIPCQALYFAVPSVALWATLTRYSTVCLAFPVCCQHLCFARVSSLSHRHRFVKHFVLCFPELREDFVTIQMCFVHRTLLECPANVINFSTFSIVMSSTLFCFFHHRPKAFVNHDSIVGCCLSVWRIAQTAHPTQSVPFSYPAVALQGNRLGRWTQTTLGRQTLA